MFNSIFDSIIILIPIAIIIGRFILQARNKRKPPPKKPPQPYIPVHFVDDVDDEPVVKKVVTEKQRPVSLLDTQSLFGNQSLAEEQRSYSVFQTEKKEPYVPQKPIVSKTLGTAKKVLPDPETKAQNNFFLNLNKLSPLKQAVVMAEVLGPPKALQ